MLECFSLLRTNADAVLIKELQRCTYPEQSIDCYKPLFSHLRIRQPQAMNSINAIRVSMIRLVKCYATPVTIAGPSFPFSPCGRL